MIELNHEQGSKDWFRARAGIPTASDFGQFLTATGAMRKGQMPATYLRKLASERVWGYVTGSGESRAMRFGNQYEDAARQMYSFCFEEARACGFCLDDGKRWGCSPDGLVGDTGGLEIKCLYPPKLAEAIACMKREETLPEHALQVQACLWVTGREWWDYCAYKPVWDAEEMGLIDIRTEQQKADAQPDLFKVRIYPDEKMHALFAENVPAFADEIDNLAGDLAEHEHEEGKDS